MLGAFTFLIFGAVLLGPTLGDVTWQIVAVAVLSLTVVRMGPVALALIGTRARLPTVAYLGWFGPRGLASIVFAALIVDEAELPHTNTILLAIFATIGLSVLAHGVSARPLTDRYATVVRGASAGCDGARRGRRAPLALPPCRRERGRVARPPDSRDGAA